MWITVAGNNSTEIDTTVVKRILSLYPEEELSRRRILDDALRNDSIDFTELKSESEKILIPWQMFFLTPTNYQTQLQHIEEQRAHKISPKLLTKRPGTGNVTSRRIVDRLIRQQNFLIHSRRFPPNPFCGSLKRLKTDTAARHIVEHVGINRDILWKDWSREDALNYLIDLVEAKNINVSRGVLSHKILPMAKVVPGEVYRNTSGFAIKDSCIPFLFLPSEINPNEIASRQIYTLIYLLVVIGLDQYKYILNKEFKFSASHRQEMVNRVHSITSEVLVPSAETEKLRDHQITVATRDKLSAKFKVSPSALITTLRIRRLISAAEYELLKPPEFEFKRQESTNRRPPRISKSIRKFCGGKSYQVISDSIRNGSLPSIQAQYLIFGAVYKKGFLKFKQDLGL